MSDEAAPLPELSPIDRDKALANTDLEDILALKKTPAFTRYFLRRLQERAEPLREALLKSPMDYDLFREKQTKLAAYTEIIGLLDQDEIGNRSIAGRVQPTTA